MAQLSTSVQNAVLMLDHLLHSNSQVISIATSAGTAANAVFVIDIEMVEGEWIRIGLFNAITQLAADNLTGAAQYGWADIPGAKRARIRRSDANGGVGVADVEVCGAGR